MFARKWVSLAQAGIGAALGAGLLPTALPRPGGEPPALAPWGAALIFGLALGLAFEGAAGRSRGRVIASVAAGYLAPFVVLAFFGLEPAAAGLVLGPGFAAAGLAAAADRSGWSGAAARRAGVRGLVGSIAVVVSCAMPMVVLSGLLRGRIGEVAGAAFGLAAMMALMAVDTPDKPPPGDPAHRPPPPPPPAT